MGGIAFLYMALLTAIEDWWERRKSLPRRIRELKRSGYTKLDFDMDGHRIIIQSYKHVPDNSA